MRPIPNSAVITQCCIKALYDAGPSAQAATDVAKTFERRKCNHLDKPKEEDECMKTMAGKQQLFAACHSVVRDADPGPPRAQARTIRTAT